MEFGLFYFADASGPGRDRYRLLLEGARFADQHGFAAIWTPERHFHPFGGLYPNPSVTAAAVAAVTERIAIRAGSVVAPLHHAARIAEEWAVVDNLSGGRAGISFAPGWHATDFALRPENYAARKRHLAATVDTVRRLWRQEAVELTDGNGDLVRVRSYPAPVQAELPAWLTSSGSPESFRLAGDLGLGVLTHLLGQDPRDLAGKIADYRDHYRRAHDGDGNVVLMLHTFLGASRDDVRAAVREPFSAYLRTSLGLWATSDLLGGLRPDELAAEDVDFLVENSFDRFFDSSGLFGTVADGRAIVDELARTGVDEIACLIDFLPDTDAVLHGLRHLTDLMRSADHAPAAVGG